MEYRLFGRTGVYVSPLVLGCMMFGQKTDLEDSCNIIDRGIDAGLNFLDTADVYAKGTSEEFVGEALRRNGKRDDIFLATKVNGRMTDDPNDIGNSRFHIIKGCEDSLRRMNVDHIDLYQLHRPDAHIAIDETLRAMDDLITSGKVRYVGTSNFGSWQVVESLWASERWGLNRVVSEQSPFNLADRRAEREHTQMCQTYGLAFIPWSPLAAGGLTGKYKRVEKQESGTRFGDETDPNKFKRFSWGVVDIAEGLEPIAEKHNATLAQIALAWVAAQPGVTAPIIGPRTMGQLEDNLGALEVKLDEEDFSAIDELAPRGTNVADYYEASFQAEPAQVLDYEFNLTDKRKILITGGAGLIGSLLIENLGDKYEFSSLDLKPNETVLSTVASVDDFDAIAPAFEGMDTVIHLAANPSPNGSWESNLKNNFIATYNVFELAKRNGVKRVIFASSNHAEGGNYLVPPWKHVNEGDYHLLEQDGYELVTEKNQIRPDGYYGVAKAYGEALGSYYNDYHGVNSFHLRIGWVIRDNDPTVNPHGLTLWLSHRDLVQIMDLCISAPDSYKYDIFNATSDNTWKIFDISHAKEALGYKPQDRAGSEYRSK